MTKLEQSIFDAMMAGNGEFADYENLASLAAEVCKGYIERAFDAGFNRGMWVEGMREDPEPMHKTEFVKLLFP